LTSVLDERRKELLGSNKLNIDTEPRFAKLFRDSQMVACNIFRSLITNLDTKGRSHLLLNRSTRYKRLEKENKEREDKLQSEQEIEHMREVVANLQDELKTTTCDKKEADENREILSKLFKEGVIDESGNLK
jgi:hypothetical protein